MKETVSQILFFHICHDCAFSRTKRLSVKRNSFSVMSLADGGFNSEILPHFILIPVEFPTHFILPIPFQSIPLNNSKLIPRRHFASFFPSLPGQDHFNPDSRFCGSDDPTRRKLQDVDLLGHFLR